MESSGFDVTEGKGGGGKCVRDGPFFPPKDARMARAEAEKSRQVETGLESTLR